MPGLLPTEQLVAAALAHPGIARVAGALAGSTGCWLVGGAVRDLLLGGRPVDLDLVVEGDASAAAADAAVRLGGAVRQHERFGTATVQAEGLAFDLARARRERYPVPGALPEVEPASLEEDLGRRDFTVNAIALGLSEDVRGRVEAVPGVFDDLVAGRLRVLHERSFIDDPTRLLRLARYGGRLDFPPEAGTGELARVAARDGALDTVSGPRIGQELLLLLAEPAAPAALSLLAELDLIEAVHPDLAPDPELGEAAVGLLGPEGVPALARLAAATAGWERVSLRDWLDRLGMTASERDRVLAAALDSERLAAELAAVDRPSRVAALARDRPPEQLALAAAQGAQARVAEWRDRLREVTLEISGDDLVAAGVPQGPEVGAGLTAALDAKLDGEIAGREEELRVAREAALASGR